MSDNDVNYHCTVAGPVGDHKGINLPGKLRLTPPPHQKGRRRTCAGLSKLADDLVALSFVRHGSDIDRVHEIMDEEGRTVPVIAKLEKPQAIENLTIIDVFDAVMVARGDMAVECPSRGSADPKADHREGWLQAKPVIVATQMLESMIHAPCPG